MGVSIIIPCRYETFEVSPGVTVLQRTLQDIYEKATGEIEVIVAFDGEPYQALPKYNNLVGIYSDWIGTKPLINKAVSLASKEYVMKLDAHCMLDKGFDEILQADMEDNWVVTPRLYILDAENWKWQDERFYDYYRLPCPLTDPKGFRFQAGGHWKERTKERLEFPIDENMKLHGSCWFMSKDFYTNKLKGLTPDNGAGSWNGEDIEITLKTWLGPWEGKLIANKKTWYAHMHRGKQRPREFSYSEREAQRSARWTAEYWMRNSWEGRAHDIDWLVDRFWPVPTWTENWKELYKEWRRTND